MIADPRRPEHQLDLPRECRCENGAPKKAFPTRKAAREYARQWPGRTFIQYRCPACHDYHNASGRTA